MNERHRQRAESDERGAVLVLALVFLVVTALTIYTVANWAGNSLDQTVQFNTASAIEFATGAAVEMEAQNMRYEYHSATTSEITCTPGSGSSVTINSVSVAVYCSIVINPDSAATRVVTLDSCPTSVSETNCVSNPYLQATVSFDDYSDSDKYQCVSTSDELTCGTAMSITSWDVV